MKNREIYDYLNNVTTPYDNTRLSEIEIEKIKKNLGLKKKKRFSVKPLVGLAAAIVIFVGVFVATNENVKAKIANFVESFFTDERVELSKADKLPEDVKKYIVNLHETITLEHMSFVIEDVAIDGKYGYLNLIYPEEYSVRYKEKNDYLYIISKVYVDGKAYMVTTSGSHEEKIGDGLISDVRDFKLEKTMPQAGDIRLGIEFSEFSNEEDKAIVELNISMDQLTKDTKLYLEDFSIPKAEDYKISKMLVNLFNPRIELVEPVDKNIYNNRKFVGTSEDSKKMLFELDNSLGENNKLYSEYKFIAKDNDGSNYKSDFTLEEFYNYKGKVSFQLYKDVYETTILGGRKLDKNGRPIFHTEKVGEEFVVDFNK